MQQDERSSVGRLQSVLFVCTANIFRSVTAEYALKTRLGADSSCVVSSAGIDVKLQPMHDWVQSRLRAKGADPASHVQRQLTGEMLDDADLVMAMGRDHQIFIREKFGLDVPLFNQACLGRDEPILDLHEVMPEWKTDPEQARAYVWSVMDIIWATAPTLLSRLR